MSGGETPYSQDIKHNLGLYENDVVESLIKHITHTIHIMFKITNIPM